MKAANREAKRSRLQARRRKIERALAQVERRLTREKGRILSLEQGIARLTPVDRQAA